MNIGDFLGLGIKEHREDEVIELYWQKPDRDSPNLVLRDRPKIPLDSNLGERGFLLCYYSRLVQELPEEYRKRNVEPPFIEVCPTKERNGCPSNVVQIPLSYIPRKPIILIKSSVKS